MNKPWTTGELRDMTRRAVIGVHIWVRMIATDKVFEAATDLEDDLHVVALPYTKGENDRLRESAYGVDWLAYPERPDGPRFLTYLDSLSVAWREQFELPNSRGWAADELGYLPQLPMAWTVEEDILYLDGTWVCPIRCLDVEKLPGCRERVSPYCLMLKLIDSWLDITLDEDGKGGWCIWTIERRWLP